MLVLFSFFHLFLRQRERERERERKRKREKEREHNSRFFLEHHPLGKCIVLFWKMEKLLKSRRLGCGFSVLAMNSLSSLITLVTTPRTSTYALSHYYSVSFMIWLYKNTPVTSPSVRMLSNGVAGGAYSVRFIYMQARARTTRVPPAGLGAWTEHSRISPRHYCAGRPHSWNLWSPACMPSLSSFFLLVWEEGWFAECCWQMMDF